MTKLAVAYSLAAGLISARVDNAAHLGGLVVGIALGAMLAKPLSAQPNQATSDGIQFTTALTVSLAAILIGIIGVRFASRSLTGEPLFWHTHHWFGTQ